MSAVNARLGSVVPPRPRHWWRWIVALVLAAVVVAVFLALPVAWNRLGDLPGEIVHYLWLMFSSPDWSKLPEALWQTWRSVAMAWIGTVLSIIVATPLGILAARGVGPRWLQIVLRVVFGVVRAVPEIIIAIIILSVTGLTPLTGALAIGVSGVGTLGKWGYEAVETVPGGAVEAVRASGGRLTDEIRWALWPAVAPAFLSFWLYRFEISVRASAVLGLIGVGGIGDMLTSYTQYREWATVGVLVLVVVVVTMALDALSGAVRRRIMEGSPIRDLAGQ